MRPENPNRKLKSSRMLNIWPHKHLSDALRKEAADTGKTLTRLVEETIAHRYGLPVDPEAFGGVKYPDHQPQNHVLNEGT